MAVISVIVPVYNVEKYLCRCVDSILLQTFTDFELILVDDGSPDNCGKICDEYAEKDNRVVVIHKENGGVSSARNAGLDVAKGEYVAFCDSDDYVKPDWLETLLKKIESADTDSVVINWKTVYDNSEGVSSRHVTHELKFSDDADIFNYIKNYILLVKSGWEVWTRIFRLSIITDNNIRFCETCENFAEDLAFVLEYTICSKGVCCIDYEGYYYYQRKNSMMYNSKIEVRLNPLNEVSKHFYNFILKRSLNRKITDNYLLIHFMIMDNQYAKLIKTNLCESVAIEASKIADKNFYYEMTKNISRFKKELNLIYGRHRAFERSNLASYTIHNNYKRYCISCKVYSKAERCYGLIRKILNRK